MGYWHSVCPACDQGRTFVMKIVNSGGLFLLCEECESAWRTPQEINVSTHFNFDGMDIERACRKDIEHAGWFRYSLIQV